MELERPNSRRSGRAVILVALATATVVVALLARCAVNRPATREFDIAGVTSVQAGDSDVVLVQDDTDKLVIRADRRTMPWVMARREGAFLSLGLPDDADPRMFAGMLGLQPPKGARISFEIHSKDVREITIAGGASFRTRGLRGDGFMLYALSEEPIVLDGVDVDELKIQMQAADVAARGRADRLYIMNSSPTGDFDGSGLEVVDAEVYPSGNGATRVNERGTVREY